MESNMNNFKWKLWIHTLDNKSWDLNSYNNIFEINNIYDYNILKENITINNLQNCMFFLMNGDILPIWEDPENREGTSLSFKIPSKNIKEEWDNIILKTICNDILKNNTNNINGVSIAPKKEFNIIKLWFKNDEVDIENNIKLYGNFINLDNYRKKKLND